MKERLKGPKIKDLLKIYRSFKHLIAIIICSKPYFLKILFH